MLRGSRTVGLVIAWAFALASCTSGGSPAGTANPIDLGADLDVAAAPDEAAAALAAMIGDPATSVAAARELLTRAGIPIISSQSGEMLNRPAEPVLQDLPVYDFAVPAVAGSVREGRAWDVEDLTTVLLRGAEVPGASKAVAGALGAWISEARKDPSAPGAFLPLVMSELGSARRPADDLTRANPRTAIDPLQMQLVLAAAFSRAARYRPNEGGVEGAMGRTGIGTGTVAQAPSPCEGAERTLDTREGKAVNTLFGEYLERRLPEAKDAMGAVGNATQFGPIAAVLSILSSITVDVTDTTQHLTHMRHEKVEPEREFDFVATVGFDSASSDMVIKCGWLVGGKIPKNGKLAGAKVRWSLRGAVVARRGHGDKAVGTGGPYRTDANGQDRLGVEPVLEEGCPGSRRCDEAIKCGTARGKGCRIEKTTGAATVRVDVSEVPSVTDLISLVPGLLSVLRNIIAAIGAPRESAVVTVEHHPSLDAIIESRQGIVGYRGHSCGGVQGPWTLRATFGSPFSGSVQTSWDFTSSDTSKVTANGSLKGPFGFSIVFSGSGGSLSSDFEGRGRFSLDWNATLVGSDDEPKIRWVGTGEAAVYVLGEGGSGRSSGSMTFPVTFGRVAACHR